MIVPVELLSMLLVMEEDQVRYPVDGRYLALAGSTLWFPKIEHTMGLGDNLNPKDDSK